MGDHNGITSDSARALLNLYEEGVRDGAQVLLNVCSSVRQIASAAKPLYELCGVKLVLIDEDMIKAAVASASRIGVIATLPTTLEPTKSFIQEYADSIGKEVRITDILVDGAFGLDQEQFKRRLIEAGSRIRSEVDAFVLAQASMAYAEQDVSRSLGLPVFSSIRYGVAAVAEAVNELKTS